MHYYAMELHSLKEYSSAFLHLKAISMLSQKIRPLVPGLALSIAVTAIAMGVEHLEISTFGFPLVDGLVFAIIIGTLVHTIWGLHRSILPGVKFASKTLLELAIVLLGASISTSAIADSGIAMFGSVVLVVFLSLGISYTIGRLLGLSDELATLVSCGNSICGNSAIVAVAAATEAESDNVASSIAFTAALGIVVVLLLPLTVTLFGLTQWQYGVIAGMTVYAVPQVLAATVPVGAISVQTGTLVKLMRVLMLGPVVLLIGLKSGRNGKAQLSLARLVPWFIIGFLAMMFARSLDVIPHAALAPIGKISTVLTIVSMAALGLSVNLRTVLASGGRVLAAGVLSILALLALSAATVALLPTH